MEETRSVAITGECLIYTLSVHCTYMVAFQLGGGGSGKTLRQRSNLDIEMQIETLLFVMCGLHGGIFFHGLPPEAALTLNASLHKPLAESHGKFPRVTSAKGRQKQRQMFCLTEIVVRPNQSSCVCFARDSVRILNML